MAILAYGLNFRTAPVDLREHIAITEEGLGEAVDRLRFEVDGVSEAAILSTCNRTELYCTAQPGQANQVADWLSSYRSVDRALLHDTTYVHWDTDAARHVMRVASGLDSQVLGEPQILGQVKTAYDTARQVGTLGPELDLLSQHTLNIAKKVRSDTEIGRNPVSVAFAAVTLARQIFGELADSHALVVGAGETAELLARHLREQGVSNMAIANRTLANAEALARQFGAEAMQLGDVATRLHDFDIVVSSTGSPLPVLGKGAVEAALKRRRFKPMFMVDIAMPRDIEPEVGELRDVYLYSIDDLTVIVEDNARKRQSAAESAEELVSEGALAFVRDRRIQAAGELVKTYRSRASETADSELARARAALAKGEDADAVIERLARTLTNKFTHSPTVAIRKASADDNADLLNYLGDIFDLDP